MPGANFPTLPPEGTPDARAVATVVNNAVGGRLNCLGEVELPAFETGTRELLVEDARVHHGSWIAAQQHWWVFTIDSRQQEFRLVVRPGVAGRVLRYAVLG